MFRKAFSSLSGLFKDTADLKHQAALHRSRGGDDVVEPSYEVYLNSCATVAATFSDMGFIFAKSGPHMTKKENGMKFIISFGTSYNNVPGKYVQMQLSVCVYSSKLKKWREQQSTPYTNGDLVSGGLIHLIEAKGKYIEWNLANKDERQLVIDDVIAHIQNIALPYLNFFIDPKIVIEILEEADIPAMGIAYAIEFALCFGDVEKAQRILNRYVSEHRDFIPDVCRYIEDFRQKGKPQIVPNQYAGQIAWVCSFYGLKFEHDWGKL